ncbi:MAG: gyrB [Gemmataceae bacterium]|nr:gyrB [Gemmataceae bacterium]
MADDTPVDDPYPATAIRTIRGPHHVRLRPEMYLGDVGPAGLHRVLFGLVEGSLAEAAAGRGRSVRVALHPDGSAEVADDGRGAPTGELEAADLEDALTNLGWPAPGGRQWFDYGIACALSDRLEVEARAGGRVVRQVFVRGERAGPPADPGPVRGDGLTIRFRPDPVVFGPHRLDRPPSATACGRPPSSTPGSGSPWPSHRQPRRRSSSRTASGRSSSGWTPAGTRCTRTRSSSAGRPTACGSRSGCGGTGTRTGSRCRS